MNYNYLLFAAFNYIYLIKFITGLILPLLIWRLMPTYINKNTN